MELARSMATRARKRGRKGNNNESVLGLPMEFKFNGQNSRREYSRNYGEGNKGGVPGIDFN